MNLKEIVTKKAHESSSNKLDVDLIPPNILKYITLEFFESIASSLSAITRSAFLYTGKVVSEKDQLVVSFVSSDQSDEIKMIMKYDYSEREGFEFVNLNKHLEKAIEVPPEVEAQPEPKEVEVVVAPVVPEPPVIELGKFVSMMDKQIEKLDKEKEEERKKMAVDTLTTALENLEKKDKTKRLIDMIEKAVDDS